MTTLFQRSEDTHEDSLSIRTTLAAVSVAVFANDHGWPNSSLGMVIIKGNTLLVQECKQVVLMAPQSLDQTAGLRILPIRSDQARVVSLRRWRRGILGP